MSSEIGLVDRLDDRPNFMQRALELAARPRFTSPNPKVGAVLVRDGAIVSEGWHEGAGTPHAEAVALAGADGRGATLYVTLEPCVHEGRTPPCAPLVADTEVVRVVVASLDPDARVSGRGVQFLRGRGVEVGVGLLEAEARSLNAAFFYSRITGRPLVSLKLALTLDGRLAAPDGSSQWITGAEARRLVHERRAEVDAVVVGAGTVVTDNPSLTARDVDAARQPLRIVVDSTGRVPSSAQVLKGTGDVLVATTAETPHEAQTAWKEAGAEVLVLDRSPQGIDLEGLVETLGRRGLLEIYCEGGGALATSLVRAGLVDRLELFYGGVMAGSGGPDIGDIGISSLTEAPRWMTHDVKRIGDDTLVTMHSPALESILHERGEKL